VLRQSSSPTSRYLADRQLGVLMAMVELGYLQSGSADCESGRSDWEGGRGSGSAV
jgi:hypothetical protein